MLQHRGMKEMRTILVLTFLNELETICKTGLIAHEEQASVLLSCLSLLFLISDLFTERNASADDAVRVQSSGWEVSAWIGLADVSSKGTA